MDVTKSPEPSEDDRLDLIARRSLALQYGVPLSGSVPEWGVIFDYAKVALAKQYGTNEDWVDIAEAIVFARRRLNFFASIIGVIAWLLPAVDRRKRRHYAEMAGLGVDADVSWRRIILETLRKDAAARSNLPPGSSWEQISTKNIRDSAYEEARRIYIHLRFRLSDS